MEITIKREKKVEVQSQVKIGRSETLELISVTTKCEFDCFIELKSQSSAHHHYHRLGTSFSK